MSGQETLNVLDVLLMPLFQEWFLKSMIWWQVMKHWRCERRLVLWMYRLHNISPQHLNMKQLSVRWVPRLLTIDHKRARVTCFQLFQWSQQHFGRCFGIVDETIRNTATEMGMKNNPDNGGECQKKSFYVYSLIIESSILSMYWLCWPP